MLNALRPGSTMMRSGVGRLVTVEINGAGAVRPRAVVRFARCPS